MAVTIPEVETVEATPEILLKEKKILSSLTATLAERFRSLFRLKGMNCLESIEIISSCFKDESELLKHEVAYVLGQMRNPLALPFLENVLRDSINQQSMVRHEAAEAIAAIGQMDSIDLLMEFVNDKDVVVRDTVILAIDGLKHKASSTENDDAERVFWSVDPAPPAKKDYSTLELEQRLMDTTLSLFERYRAMFALRNRGDTESVLALSQGFTDSSALFRHEIAYVFGQMQHPASVPSLLKVLGNKGEMSMVRHEAAEALGSIATPECFPALQEFRDDTCRTVAESCVVGLDMYEYETNPQQFDKGIN